MKNYTVRVSYTDRKLGPGNGITARVSASGFHTAIKKAVHRFWNGSTHKEHNDVRRDGLNVFAREIKVDKTPEA